MMKHRLKLSSVIVGLMFAVTTLAYGAWSESRSVTFSQNYGLPSVGMDKTFGPTLPATMQMRLAGMFRGKLLNMSLPGDAEFSGEAFSVDGRTGQGSMSTDVGFSLGAWVTIGIPSLNYDRTFDILKLLDTSSIDLRWQKSTSFTPFLLGGKRASMAVSITKKNLFNIDISNLVLPGVPLVAAGVVLYSDSILNLGLEGKRITSTKPSGNITSDSGTLLSQTGGTTTLDYYANLSSSLELGVWPGVYVKVGWLNWGYAPARIKMDIPVPASVPINFPATSVSFPSLQGVFVSGSLSVQEGSSANYSSVASYSSGGSSRTVTGTSLWFEDSLYASINNNGLLSTLSVSSDKPVTITAIYGGISGARYVTIKDTTPPSTPDTTPPTVSISSPCSSSCSSSASSITVSGSVTDSGGSGLNLVMVLNETNASFGTNYGLSGNSATFSVPGISLDQGVNTIKVTVFDIAGNGTDTTISVTYNLQQAPSVATNSATNVGQTNATLSASVNPNGATTTLYFDYGITSSYGTQVAYGNIGAGTSAVTQPYGLSSLSCNTLYYYRARATNSAGTSYGSARTFTTLACPPPPDTTQPSISITSPTSGSTYNTTSGSLAIAGTASDNVGVTQVSWSNNRGGSGTASGTSSWSKSGIALYSGTNIITVTARDAAGNTRTDTLTVTYNNPSDTTDPTIAITSPTTASTYTTSSSSLNIGGTASDNVGVTQVRWRNNRGGSGTASGTTSWSRSGITLYSGTNVITVTARDAAGNTRTDTLTVTYNSPDTIAPSISITSPTSASSYSTTSGSLSIGGNASDNIGVTQVSWSNNRGGSGTASGTTSWSRSGITLYSGTNVITVTARDAAANISTDTLTMTYTPAGASIIVTPTSGLTTTEVGGTATFTIVLNSQPVANVSIGLSSSDTTEGTVSSPSLMFTASNWATPQTVTVTGVDDTVTDGDQNYTIVTAAATSADTNYNGFNPADVSMTNQDDEGVLDTDSDGLPDSWEIQYFGDLVTANATTDADGDGISDLNEFLNGTDPTTESTITLQPGSGEGKDIWTTSVYSYAPGDGGSGGGQDNEELRVGGWSDTYLSLMEFDLTGLPQQASSAKLWLYCFSSNSGSVTSMYLDRISEYWNWDRSDRLWWVDRPATVQWSQGEISAPVVGSWYEIDITDLYNAWQDGTYVNYGLQLRPTSTSNNFNKFYSSDYDIDPALRPKLVVTHFQQNQDTTPDAFSFSDDTNVVLSTLTASGAITVAGINSATNISVTGGEYSINDGAFTSSAGTVNNGDTVAVRHTSSGSFSTTTDTVVTIGGVTDTYASTTLAEDTTAVDSDSDGLSDSWETTYFGNLTTTDGTTDLDDDGLTEQGEYQSGTDPNNTDTDGDGDSDGDEVLYGANPADALDTLDSHRPNTPVILPMAGDAALRDQIFDVEGFTDPDQAQGDYLTASKWEISTDQNFSNGSSIFSETLEKNTDDNEVDYRQLLMPDSILVKATDYWVRTRHQDSVDLWSVWSVPLAFSTVATDPNDVDDNDIDDSYQVTGYTDTNGNNIDDSTEGIGTLYDAEGGATIGIRAGSGTLGSLIAIPGSDIPTGQMPADPMSYGLFSFRVDGLLVDAVNPAMADVTFYFPEPLPSGTKWYKYDSVSGTMTDFTANVTFSGNQAIVTLTDGGIGDADNVINGVIVDPSGPALPPVPPVGSPDNNGNGNSTSTSSNGGGGGGGGSLNPLLLLMMICSLFYFVRQRYKK